jgi:hypothetical protein
MRAVRKTPGAGPCRDGNPDHWKDTPTDRNSEQHGKGIPHSKSCSMGLSGPVGDCSVSGGFALQQPGEVESSDHAFGAAFVLEIDPAFRRRATAAGRQRGIGENAGFNQSPHRPRPSIRPHGCQVRPSPPAPTSGLRRCCGGSAPCFGPTSRPRCHRWPPRSKRRPARSQPFGSCPARNENLAPHRYGTLLLPNRGSTGAGSFRRKSNRKILHSRWRTSDATS